MLEPHHNVSLSQSGAAFRRSSPSLGLAGMAQSLGKGDVTEEVGHMCEAPVSPSWMSCMHGRWLSIRCDEPHFEEQMGWVATTRLETSSLKAGRTKSMPRAKQCFLQPGNAF